MFQGLNVAMFWEKVDFTEYLPMVPTSAITGDGMGDLIALLVQHSTKNLTSKLMLSMEVEAIVMEVCNQNNCVYSVHMNCIRSLYSVF